jgi:hypothetical protein
MYRFFVVLELIAIAPMAFAGQPHVAQVVGKFVETLHSDVNVSGSVVVGVASNQTGGGHAVQNLRLYNARTPTNGQICLSLQSRDGVYSSRNTFSLPKESAGAMVLVPYDRSAHLDKLSAYGPNELAVRANAGSCEGKAGNEYFVMDAAGTKPPAAIRVYLNSFGASDVFFRMKGAAAAECRPVTEGRRTSFDYWCDIPWPRGGNERLEVEIQRERYGRELPAVSLSLLLKPRE